MSSPLIRRLVGKRQPRPGYIWQDKDLVAIESAEAAAKHERYGPKEMTAPPT